MVSAALAPFLALALLAGAAAARLLSTSVLCCFATVLLLPLTGADATFLPAAVAVCALSLALALALLPLSRAEVEGFFSDVRVLAAVVVTAALAGRADFAGTGLACVTARAEVFSAADVFVDALPLPDRGAFEVTLSVALAFAIGTLTFTRTGEKGFAIQTGYCSTRYLPAFLTGEVFTCKIKA
nr:hypothetical protein [Cupriavidus gilardii]